MPVPSSVTMQSVRSTNVSEVGLEEETGTLFVTFNNGSTYAYEGQSEAVLQDLLASNSPGSYVNKYLRQLPARRV